MTPEQQREQWLKRILPAMGVLIVYFVIVSGFVTGKTKKAEEEYKILMSKGIDPSMLSSREQNQSKLAEELAKLDAEEKAIREKMATNSGFLASKETQNDTLDKVSTIFANNSLQVLEEKRDDQLALSGLTKSFVELQTYLDEVAAATPVADKTTPVGTTTPETPPSPAPAKPTNKTVNVWTIHYSGSYNDNYRMLNALLTSNSKALPVSLTMQSLKDNTSGQLEWNLTLWM